MVALPGKKGGKLDAPESSLPKNVIDRLKKIEARAFSAGGRKDLIQGRGGGRRRNTDQKGTRTVLPYSLREKKKRTPK